MGSVCCCLRDDCEDYVNPNSAVYRNCICVRCFMQNCLRMYTSLFQRGEEHAISSSAQGTANLTSSASNDNSLIDMYRSPPRPLPYDADPRYLRLQREGLVSRREKGSSHGHEETEPLRSNNLSDADSDSYTSGGKRNDILREGQYKEYNSKSSLKLTTPKVTSGYTHVYSSSEDDEVCPTCLEEYTPENPKIVTNCSHHFHLGCIYEWMERSESCPVCGKVMEFET